jgi:hypothetical protein
MEQFQLQPPEECLQKKADDYVNDKAVMEMEGPAFDAGARIRQGKSTDIKGDLKIIVEWKSPRSVHYISRNEPKEIQAAIDLAISRHDEVVEAVSALTKLVGVGIPMASAILTAIFPERYTVIDFRALEALGHKPESVDFYEEYLTFCRSLAADLAQRGVIHPQKDHSAPTVLRALDRALWQWSASKGILKSE